MPYAVKLLVGCIVNLYIIDKVNPEILMRIVWDFTSVPVSYSLFIAFIVVGDIFTLIFYFSGDFYIYLVFSVAKYLYGKLR